jgi:prephenate dehydrogenase
MSFGIIGYGSFGRFLADILGGFGDVLVYKRGETGKPGDNKVDFTTFEKAASADAVILAVGLESLDELSRQLADFVSEKTLVVDVSSVKLKPIEILTENLGGKCKILAMHPLFGPQTTKDGSIAGESIVVCPPDFPGQDEAVDFLENKLKLKVIKMSAEEHDKEMAWVHALTFFVGRGLMELNPPKSILATGYYQKLLDLVELESSHSKELFDTVQKGNPFAKEIRERFLDELKKINQGING